MSPLAHSMFFMMSEFRKTLSFRVKYTKFPAILARFTLGPCKRIFLNSPCNFQIPLNIFPIAILEQRFCYFASMAVLM